VDLTASPVETARRILELYPRLAQHGQGNDAAYALWYSEMLRLTEPDGLIFATAFYDGLKPPPGDRIRFLGAKSRSVIVPLPPVRTS
jgi:hypothetical protein